MKTHCVYFYTEGLKVDGVPTVDVRPSIERFKKEVEGGGSFDRIHAYRYSDVKAMKPEMVKSVETPGIKSGGRHGFFRWKPFIIWEVMKQIEEGDIVVYTDCHIEKYPQYVEGLGQLGKYATDLLNGRGYDFFMGTENETMQLEEHCKREVIEAVGLEYESIRKALLLNARVLFIRNTGVMREKVVRPWLELCEHPDWIRKDIDDVCIFESGTKYRNHTEDQSLLNLVVRRAQIEGILSWDIGQYCFRDRRCIPSAFHKVSSKKSKEVGGYLLENIDNGFQRLENGGMEVQRYGDVLTMKIKGRGRSPWRWLGKHLKRGDYVIRFEIMFRGSVPERGENRGWKLHYPERIYNDFLVGMEVGEWREVKIGCQVREDSLGIFIWDGLESPNEILIRGIRMTKMNYQNHTRQHYIERFVGIPFESESGARTIYTRDGVYCLDACCDIRERVCIWKKLVPLRGTYSIRFRVYFEGRVLSVRDVWGVWIEKPERILNRWAKGLSPDEWHEVELVLDLVENETMVGFIWENVLKKGDKIKMRDFEVSVLH